MELEGRPGVSECGRRVGVVSVATVAVNEITVMACDLPPGTPSQRAVFRPAEGIAVETLAFFATSEAAGTGLFSILRSGGTGQSRLFE